MTCAGGEMADTPALGAGAARHGGSSPLPRTIFAVRRFYCARSKQTALLAREDLKSLSNIFEDFLIRKNGKAVLSL
jgi:hypothetical protein